MLLIKYYKNIQNILKILINHHHTNNSNKIFMKNLNLIMQIFSL